MAKLSMKLKQKAPAKFSTRKYNRCKICGRPHACVTTACAVSASGLWLIRARSPAFARLPGKSFVLILRWLGSTYTKYAVASPPCLRTKSHTISKREYLLI